LYPELTGYFVVIPNIAVGTCLHAMADEARHFVP